MRVAIRLLDPRLPGWGFPRRGSDGAAGLDLHACLDAPLTLAPQAPALLVPTGLSVRIRDPDWCGLVFARSGLGHHRGLVLGNGTGVIDADYEGPLLVSAWNRDPVESITIAPGDRIAQLVLARVVVPTFEIEDDADDAQGSDGQASDVLGDGSRRGTGGFGSTGVG